MFKKTLEQVVTYEAGKPIELVVREQGIKPSEIIKLGSNENPYGTSPRVIEMIQQNAHKASLYPDDSMFELKNALASKFSVKSHNIIIGAGSDQILEFCMHALNHDNACVLMAKTTFAMYEVYAKIANVEICKTPSDEHKLEEFESLYRATLERGKRVSAIFLCVPNNPLGECLDSESVEQFIQKINKDTLIIIDGAYQEFAAYKDRAKAFCVDRLIEKYENVIYLGTFSKAYGLGGMRVGYGIADSKIIAMLYKVRAPFNITTLSLQAAITALQESEFVAQCVEQNAKEMLDYESFARENGFSFIPSYANFITLSREDVDSTHLCQWLLQKGLIIRNLASYGLNAFRITIGTKKQNERVFELLKAYIVNHLSHHS